MCIPILIVEHRPALARDAVRHPAARQAQQVDHAGVEPVDGAGLGIREAQAAPGDAGGHEQDEERAHAVVAEALPHFGEEEGREAPRMAEETAVGARRVQRLLEVWAGCHRMTGNAKCKWFVRLEASIGYLQCCWVTMERYPPHVER